MSIFIERLYPSTLKTYIKEGGLATYAQAYACAKIWKECHLEDNLVIHIENTYSNDPIPIHMGIFPTTNQNQHYIICIHASNFVRAPLYTKPAIMS